jgi:hypothetical protein
MWSGKQVPLRVIPELTEVEGHARLVSRDLSIVTWRNRKSVAWTN